MASDTAPQPPPNGALPLNGTDPSSATDTNGETAATSTKLSADEIALYDRQIRLWGAQAQERIRSAKVLLVSLRALGTEIAKNLTLAGISSLTIIDDEPVTEDDLGAQFFLREEDIGKPRAEAAIPRIQELNPRVQVQADGGKDALIAKDPTYYNGFDCIIACDHDMMTLSTINTCARLVGRPFYAAGIHGFYGYIFTDLVNHEFVIEREVSNRPTQAGALETLTRSVVSVTNKKEPSGKNLETVKKTETYCPLLLANSSPLPPDVTSNRRKLKQVPPLLPCLRAVFEFQRDYSHLPSIQNQQDLAVFTTLATNKARELMLPPETLRADFLRSFIQNIGAEITPTAAFVGGRLSEDVINVLGKREQPIQNFALFDGDTLEGRIYCLYTMPPELAMSLNPLPMDGMQMDMGGMDMAGFGMPDMNGFAQMPNMPMGDFQGMPMGNGNGIDGNGNGIQPPADSAQDGHPAANEAAQQQGVVPPS
ncbi:hypothetical protein PRZ48_006891 [Zasmidium cellare]|uniref:Ubiquitin-like 1-activating enzyme E1A n=1 Tax=Zasmidium cellare TaxID=395010 RepID=A0ABR0EIN6_ZASCE|nr:hypothetical protein PRZ48_006891 [Zasmidium cellare]